MRSFLRHTALIASLSLTAWAFPGCSQDEGSAGKMEGAMPGAKTGAMDKGKMEGGAMDKGKMDGAMDKGKMDGAMDKGKMDGSPK